MAQLEREVWYYRLDIRGRYLDQDVINTYFYLQSTLSPIVENPAGELLSMWSSRFGAFYDHFGVDVMQYNSVRIRRFNGEGGQQTSQVFAYAASGDDTGAGLPPQISAVVKRKGGNTGTRRWRGRLHLCGIPAADITGNTIGNATTSWTLLTLLAGRVKERLSLTGAGGGLIFSVIPVIGNFRKKLLPSEQYSSIAIDSTEARAFLGTQRHRAPGHGRYG